MAVAPWGDRPLEADDLLDTDAVADLLGLRRSTVEDYARRGIVPSVRLGRHRRFIRADVERWLVDQRMT